MMVRKSKFYTRLQVRRTDKTKEAAYHSLDEYMVHVDEWYDTYEHTRPGVERNVYLATDDSTVIEDARHK